MKKSLFALAFSGILASHAAFANPPLIGVEIPVESLLKLEPKTVYMIMSDDKGAVRVVKVIHESLPIGVPFLKLAPKTENGMTTLGGCYVRNNGGWIWVDPCLD